MNIEITQEEIIEATQNLIYDRALNDATEADEKAIAQLIKNCLESAIEDIMNNPEQYLDSDKLEQCFPMSHSNYQKLMERSIPLAHTL